MRAILRCPHCGLETRDGSDMDSMSTTKQKKCTECGKTSYHPMIGYEFTFEDTPEGVPYE